MGLLTWFEDDDGGGAYKEFEACRRQRRYDAALLLARIKDVLELGLEEAAGDSVQGTNVFLYEVKQAAVIYAVEEPSWIDDGHGGFNMVQIGADVLVLWIGDASSGWSDLIDAARQRLADLE